MDYNIKYKFISDGSWFKKGFECVVQDGTALWDLDDSNKDTEITFEELITRKHRIMGLFRGLRISENEGSEGSPIGTERCDDGEMCGLDEFEIIKK